MIEVMLRNKAWLSGSFQLKAELSSLFLETPDHALTLLFVIVDSTWVMVIDTMFEHMIDDTSQFMGGGNIGYRCPMTGLHTAIESTKSRVRTTHRLGREAQCSGNGIVRFVRVTPLDLASTDFIVGAESQPGSEMTSRRPLAHIRADVRQDGLCRTGINPINVGEVYARHSIETSRQVVIGLVLAPPALVGVWGRRAHLIKRKRLQLSVHRLHLHVQCRHLPTVRLVQFDRLLQREEVFSPPIARQRAGNLLSTPWGRASPPAPPGCARQPEWRG